MTPTFDDLRLQSMPCPQPCGKHTVTGARQPLIYCPWQVPLVPGRWQVLWQEGADA